jgi:hypothetical protein
MVYKFEMERAREQSRKDRAKPAKKRRKEQADHEDC